MAYSSLPSNEDSRQREVLEFRVVEEFADRLFAPTEGKKLGENCDRPLLRRLRSNAVIPAARE
jgi:hypothetical protein